MSHRKRDSNGKKLPKKNARPRTKLRWQKRHVTIKQMEQLPVEKPLDIGESNFSGMKKVDL